MVDRDELGAWLRLLETPELGRESARKLLAAFGSPQAVIAAFSAARREVVGALQSTALDTSPDACAALVETTLAWLNAETPEPRAAIALGDPRYPQPCSNRPTRRCCSMRRAGWNCCRPRQSRSSAAETRRRKAATTPATSPAI